MRSSTRKALLWQGLSLLLTFAGLILSTLVIIGVFLGPPENSFSNLSDGDLLLVLVGTLLMVVGRLIGWKFGIGVGSMTDSVSDLRDQQPEPSTLQELGYRIPPDSSETGDSKFTYEDGTVYVVCEACGARNESGFSYCRNCSAELPE
jgi:hypothetical protein